MVSIVEDTSQNLGYCILINYIFWCSVPLLRWLLTASYHLGLHFIPVQSVRDLWWMNWYCDMFFLEYFSFPLSGVFLCMVHIHIHLPLMLCSLNIERLQIKPIRRIWCAVYCQFCVCGDYPVCWLSVHGSKLLRLMTRVGNNLI